MNAHGTAFAIAEQIRKNLADVGFKAKVNHRDIAKRRA